MKRILSLVILLLVSFVGFAQAPSNYTNINGRYRWIAGMFDSTFSLPKGATPSLRTGGSSNPGALFYRTTDSTVKYWTGTQWLTVADTTRYVPYIGATKNVDLGQYGLKSKYLEFDTSSQAVTERRLQWSNADGTLQFGMTNGSTITNRIGLEQFARVKNVDATQINKGDVVYLFGASGDRAAVKKADNRQDATSSKTLGVATEDIAVNDVGFVGTFGVVGKLDLSAYNPGDILYLDSIPGKMTKTKPQAPYHLVFIGVVERANSGNGLLFTNVQNGYELEELHNVRITSPVRNNALLAYDSVRALWVDTTLNAIGGVTGSGTTNYISKFTGTNTIGNSQIYDNGTNVGVGTISPAQKLDVNGNAYVNGQLLAGDTSVSTIPIQGADFNPTVFGRKAVTNTLSNDPRTIGVLGQTIARGSVANRLVGGAFFTGTDSSNSQNISQLRALQGWTIHNGTGTVTNAWGSYNVITNNQTGTITNAYGSVSGVENRSTGYIPKLHGQSLEVWNNNGGAIDTVFGQTVSIYNSNPASTIGAAYGVSIGKGMITNTGGTHYWRNSGTIGTSYGLYLDSSIDVGINKYSIYSFSNSPSYFRGSLGLGTSSPDSMLTVTNGALFQRGVRLSGLPTAAGTKALRVDVNGTLSVADTLTNGVSGSLTANFIPKATGATTLNNSPLSVGSGVVGLGLGVVPPNSWSNYWALQLANGVSLASYNYADIPIGWLGTNAYHDGIGDIRVSNGAANKYLQDRGNHKWYVAGYGASGSYISWTQPMILDTLNRLTIGVTTPDSMFKVAQGVHLERGVRMSGLPTGVGTKAVRINANGTLSVADTLANGISGTGTTNYIPKFTGSSAIGNSVLYETGGNIGIGTITPSSSGSYRYLTITGGSVSNGGVVELQTSDNARNLQFYVNNVGGNINMTTNNPIVFYTNTSERMRLDASGNLGIGTSSPTYKLNVLAGAGTQAIFQAGQSGVSNGYTINSNGTNLTYQWYNGSNEAMRLDASGNLGLGVTPSAWIGTWKAMQINSASLTARNDGLGTILGQNWYINTSGQDIYQSSSFASIYYQTAGEHRWYTAPSGTAGNAISFTQAMTLDASGRLGIGTTSPREKLDVSGNIVTAWGGDYFIGTEYLDGADYQNGLLVNGNQRSTGVIAKGASGSTPYIWFGTGITPTERMRITSGGNVGIGTSSPNIYYSDKFVVYAGSENGITIANSGTTGSQYLMFARGTTGSDRYKGYIEYAHTGDNMVFGTNATERMRITSVGSVLVGTTIDAGYKFQINGSSYIKAGNGNQLQLDNTGERYTQLTFTNNASATKGALWFDNTNSLFELFANTGIGLTFLTSGSERMRITSSGELLINTTSDAGDYKLQVNGNGLFSGRLNVNNAPDDADIAMTVKAPSGVGKYIMFGRDASDIAKFTLSSSGNIETTGSIKTAAPSGYTAKPWKLGEVASTSVTLDTTRYVAVDIDGVVYYLALVTLN